jgi:conjugative relaxase-like TrwC/TraI family protein
MLNMTPITDAGRAADYFGKSDSGYYIQDDEMHREWGGKGAAALGLAGTPTQLQLERLLRGLDPHDGSQLTAKLIEGRTAGDDLTARLPKGVTTAMENGDERIQPMMWKVLRETMADVERYAMSRVRKNNMDTDRVTGNVVWLAVEHPDTRPTKEDGKADWDRHIHVLAFNLTQDFEEDGQWKALKTKEIFELRKYFSHAFDLRMSKALADAGYRIKTDLKATERGGKKYHTWDIEAAPGHETGWKSINKKNSRRHDEIEEEKKRVVAKIKKKNPNAPDELSAVAASKLALTTRLEKREDMTLADLREYWASRITPEEGEAIAETIRRAKCGENPPQENTLEDAMAYAIAHRFQRNSVLGWHDLAATAMERCMGSAFPEELEAEAKRQGVLFKSGEVSTRDVLEQEQRIIAFARMGVGKFHPLHPGQAKGLEGLSDEQRAAVVHVHNSHDQVMLIRGDPGTGKTTAMKPALAKLGARVELLAPSAIASRTTLRKEGFKEANTVAAFLGDSDRQEKLRDGGLIWVDEAGMLAIDDLEKLCKIAKSLDARIVLQGDPKQHRAVDRDGNMLEVLHSHALLPVAKLTKIQRQQGEYAGIVAAIRDREFDKADAMMRNLGWVVEGEGHDALVAEYARAIEEKKPNGEFASVIVIDPTHKDGEILTQKLRELRKEKGLVKGEEKTFTRLVQLDMTPAQLADADQYDGTEVIQFFRNCGQFKAGMRVKADELLPHLAEVNPAYFAAFRETEINMAVGDTLRVTNNGRDATGKHRLDNGSVVTVKRFTKDGIMLGNGWVIPQTFAHVRHGLVETSPGTQSKTEDIVLTAMNKASRGATSATQTLVTLSRGRSRGMLFTDMTREELLAAVARDENRKSATELFYEPPAEAPAPLATARTPEHRQFFERMQKLTRETRLRLEHDAMIAARALGRHQERQLGHEL